jgi:hypothetical protein
MVKYYYAFMLCTVLRSGLLIEFTVINFNKLASNKICQPTNNGWSSIQILSFINLFAVAPFLRYLPIFGILKILNEGKKRSDDTSSI